MTHLGAGGGLAVRLTCGCTPRLGGGGEIRLNAGAGWGPPCAGGGFRGRGLADGGTTLGAGGGVNSGGLIDGGTAMDARGTAALTFGPGGGELSGTGGNAILVLPGARAGAVLTGTVAAASGPAEAKVGARISAGNGAGAGVVSTGKG